jgi:hypothetical protein
MLQAASYQGFPDIEHHRLYLFRKNPMVAEFLETNPLTTARRDQSVYSMSYPCLTLIMLAFGVLFVSLIMMIG